MVDPDMNLQDNAPAENGEDTKTRKTVRLKPSAMPTGINLTPPLPDANAQSDASEEDGDDTKTRKTVRLKPSATPAGINLNPLPKAQLTDPLSGRDTDTGNLEVMEDTQTRRTVKLRPIATQTTGIPINRPPVPGAEAKPAGDGSNTQTRKTIVLKPTAVAPAVKIEGPTGAAPESNDTKTRKTVRLRPSAVTPPPMVDISKSAANEESEPEFESSDTIKIARPPRPGSLIPPRPMVLPGQNPNLAGGMPSHSLPVAKPLPPQTPLPKPGEKQQSTAVPHIPSVPHIPDPVAPKPTGEEELLLKPAGSRNDAPPTEAEKEPEGPVTVLNAPGTETAAIPGGVQAALPTLEGQSPLAALQPLNAAKPAASKLYLGIAAASLILIAGALTLTTVQYLNLCMRQNIELPFLSQSK